MSLDLESRVLELEIENERRKCYWYSMSIIFCLLVGVTILAQGQIFSGTALLIVVFLNLYFMYLSLKKTKALRAERKK